MQNQINASSSLIVDPIPDQYTGATPYLYIDNAPAAIEFYKKAFGAKELVRLKDKNNKVTHCELEIGKARIMLSDEYPDLGCLSPKNIGGTSCGFTLYFENAEEAFTKALAAGATEIRRVEKQFCGDLEGKIVDPFGHHWFLATRVENVSYDQFKERAEAVLKLH